MKKDNTLLWVGLGSVLVVGVVLFFVLRRKDDKKDKGQLMDEEQPPVEETNTGKLKVGNTLIDPSKFKIDMDKVKAILNAPKSRQEKYDRLKQSGVPESTINLVKKADDQAEKNRFSQTIKNLQQAQRDAEFERLTGIKPRKFGTYAGNPSLGGSGLTL